MTNSLLLSVTSIKMENSFYVADNGRKGQRMYISDEEWKKILNKEAS